MAKIKEVLLVTGGNGLTGSNVALLARRHGHAVRALVRKTGGMEPLQDAGVEIVQGDVTDRASLDRAMAGATAVVHTAALLGGTWSKVSAEEFWAVNHQGSLNVFDAARQAGVRRTVTIDTHSIVDPAFTHTERSPIILIEEINSQYVRAKRAAYYGAMHRASQGQDICFVTPAAIYGPGVFVQRALDPTSFTSVLLRGVRGEIREYVKFPMFWSYVVDLAEICLRALERGEVGRRYLSMGAEADVSSLGAFCNQAAEIAGSPHRVREIDPHAKDAPDIGTMRQFAMRTFAVPYIDCSTTTAALGYSPTPRDKAIRATIEWLRRVGELPQAAQQAVG
jgi:dihydroflavonol-4-reductase